jgi:NAD(P)-dependent dehydrogenase (short-subunit alcohol dehydrogenase family)
MRQFMSNLAGKVAVVTGASKGIGAAIAKGFSSAWVSGEIIIAGGGLR